MRLLIKTFITCFILIYFFNNVYAGELGVTPASIEFNLNSTEINCQEIKVISNVKSDLKINDYWRETKSRDLEKYTNLSKDYRINLFAETHNYKSEGKIKICLRARKPGNYYGVLLLSYPQRKVGVGVWMNVTVRGEDKINLTFLKNIENAGLLFVILIESTFLNSVILTLLFVYRKRIKLKQNSI